MTSIENHDFFCTNIYFILESRLFRHILDIYLCYSCYILFKYYKLNNNLQNSNIGFLLLITDP